MDTPNYEMQDHAFDDSLGGNTCAKCGMNRSIHPWWRGLSDGDIDMTIASGKAPVSREAGECVTVPRGYLERRSKIIPAGAQEVPVGQRVLTVFLSPGDGDRVIVEVNRHASDVTAVERIRIRQELETWLIGDLPRKDAGLINGRRIVDEINRICSGEG